MTAEFLTINDIQEQMRAAGSHWWDPQTMRFFGTRVCGDVYQGDGGVYFVTSERPPSGKREYTVRGYNPESRQVNTIGQVCGYATKAAAIREARKLAGNCVRQASEPLKPITEAEQFLADCQSHGDAEANGAITTRIIAEAKIHHHLMELWCSDEKFCRGINEEGEHPQIVKIRKLIAELAEGIGAKGVLFSGDPRCVTVKLIWHDGETNDYGKEGWCVPGA